MSHGVTRATALTGSWTTGSAYSFLWRFLCVVHDEHPAFQIRPAPSQTCFFNAKVGHRPWNILCHLTWVLVSHVRPWFSGVWTLYSSTMVARALDTELCPFRHWNRSRRFPCMGLWCDNERHTVSLPGCHNYTPSVHALQGTNRSAGPVPALGSPLPSLFQVFSCLSLHQKLRSWHLLILVPQPRPLHLPFRDPALRRLLVRVGAYWHNKGQKKCSVPLIQEH